MIYINATSVISAQNGFRNPGFWTNREKLAHESALQVPDFKEFIPVASLRRLSPVLRCAVASAIDCKAQSGSEFDSIIAGTALGCLVDTEKFLTTAHTVTGDFLPPTSFIQSTHNTIAGQISLVLGNHSYNMTHTQNGVSFEIALLDALLRVHEGFKNVLVGAADESIGFLEELKQSHLKTNRPVIGGTAFFTLEHQGETQLQDVQVFSQIGTSAATALHEYLSGRTLEPEHFDLVLHNGVSELSGWENAENYEDYFGFSLTGSALAMAAGVSFLSSRTAGKVLVVNHSCGQDLGIISLSK